MTMSLSGSELGALRNLGFIGHGYVGSATSRALRAVASVAYYDPAISGSTPLDVLVDRSDALFVCVPTPHRADGSADTRLVFDVLAAVADGLDGKLVVLKSTVPPGTCDRLVSRWPDLQLVYAPEFLRERHHLDDAAAPARVVLGWASSTGTHTKRLLRALFARRFPDVPKVELRAQEAELLKYTSNALFGVKVSFANEIAELARSMDLDWEPIREALVLDPRVGDGHLMVPGPDGRRGFGGACLPKDMAGLLAVARGEGVDLDVVDAAVSANRRRRR